MKRSKITIFASSFLGGGFGFPLASSAFFSGQSTKRGPQYNYPWLNQSVPKTPTIVVPDMRKKYSSASEAGLAQVAATPSPRITVKQGEQE